jgi:DNA-damage-inducible protein D
MEWHLMETNQVQMLTETFEGHSQLTETGVEYWLARDLQQLLGYTEWRNFLKVVTKAKTACEVSEHRIADHFVDVNKMVEIGSGTQRAIDDVMLTRYACYLIAQNGDPAKQEIAFAQTYFAVRTRRAELIEQRLLEAERVSARKKLSDTEKELSLVIFEQTGGNDDFALIRSKGDQALFGKTTQAMKAQWRVPDNRPLADFAPTIILKAKDFATEITIHNARANNMRNEPQISQEHVTNNAAVRQTLLNRGIRPESLPPVEDVKKVERRLTADEKKALKNPEKLKGA